MSVDKPVELWISYGRYYFSNVNDENAFHVIDFSAYERLQDKVDIAKEMFKKIINHNGIASWIAKEALKQLEEEK